MESRQLYVGLLAGRRRRAWLALALSFGLCASALATTTAVVETVQWPAWVERAGQKQPLSAGQRLQSGDNLLTGDQGRLIIRLADGSAVKLGEQASLGFTHLRERGRLASGVLEAGLEIARGAFRFTTGLFQQTLGKRQVDVRLATITIGVRGTDIWGKSTPERDWALLIEGSVSYAERGAASQSTSPERLDQSLQYVFSERGGPLGRQMAKADEVGVWAAETEPRADAPAGRAGGAYVADVVRVADRRDARRAAETLRAAGYPVSVRQAKGDFVVYLPGASSAGEARRLAEQLRPLTER